MVLLRKHSFDRLLLAGPDESLAVLKRELPRPLRARLAGTISVPLFASDAEVLEATVSAAESIERRTEQRLVDELLEAAATPHVLRARLAARSRESDITSDARLELWPALRRGFVEPAEMYGASSVDTQQAADVSVGDALALLQQEAAR